MKKHNKKQTTKKQTAKRTRPVQKEEKGFAPTHVFDVRASIAFEVPKSASGDPVRWLTEQSELRKQSRHDALRVIRFRDIRKKK